MEGDLRRAPSGRLRWRFLAGAALLALWLGLGGGPAAAQTITPGAASPSPSDDGLDQNSFYLEADSITQDDKSKVTTARGHVEVRYRGRTLRAQTLTYNSDTEVVAAKGDVVVVNADGTSEFAKELVLDKDLSQGVALGFSARLSGNVKLAADTVIRHSTDLAELNQAIYTPCDICAKDGQPKSPTWSIRASQAVEDKTKHLIYYKNAVIQVLGVPVFYTPVFWNADADATSRSGFLSPFVQFSKRRGFSYEQPYLWVLSPSQDLIIAPMINTEINPFLNLDWRARFPNGAINARVGYTYENEFDNNGDVIPGSALTSRGYVLANGAFDIDPNWKWGFAAERVSDDLLFDRYDILGVYQRRGLFETDSRRLLSQLYTVREDQDSYLSISAMDFQGLRVGDVDSEMPIVAPLIEGRFEPEQAILGGRLHIEGSAVVVTREHELGEPTEPGLDDRRATGEADWRRVFTFDDGLRVEPFGSGRFDLYNVANVTPGSPDQTTDRTIGTAGVDVSWPLIRQSESSTIILEPLAEAAISPNASVNPNIPEQDAYDFVFDETDLFDSNRAPGFDAYDAGARFNVGGRATIDWGDGRDAHAFIGRSFRTTPDPLIPAISGYSGRSSDWIMAASTDPVRGLTLYGRTQVDSDSFTLRREEFGASFLLPFLRGYVRYLKDDTNPTGRLRGIEGAADLFFTKHWGAVADVTRDLQNRVWVRRDFGIAYEDDCARIEVIYHHEAPIPGLGPPIDSVQVRLTLATLGEQGYRDDGQR